MTTQPYKYDTYLRSGNYPEIEALVQYLVHGKESDTQQEATSTAQRIRTDRIGRILVACGWKEEVVSRWFEKMNDSMIPFQHDQNFIEEEDN